MSVRGYRVDTLSRERLVDQLVEAYVDWREACARVDDAYRFWAGESGGRGRVAFGSYVAALDAEERSAQVYAVLVRRADALVWSEGSPAEPVGPAGGVGWP
jgi:hypothetical protein